MTMGIKYRNFRRPPRVGPLNGGLETILTLLIFASICLLLVYQASDSKVISAVLFIPVLACAYGIIVELLNIFSEGKSKDETGR